MASKIYQYKLVLLGESAVGKSSIVLRFVRNSFNEHQESTIGAAFLTQSVNVDGDTLKFEIWDTAGQERYHSLAPMYYRGAHAAVVVYDVSSAESFERGKTWVKELQRQAMPNIVIALVGNKIDLDARKVDKQEAEEYAQEMGLLYIEASARSGENISQIFQLIAGKLPKGDQHLASSRSLSGTRRVQLKYDDSSSQGRCC